MQGVVRFWLDRGVDGFRLDAIDRLLKDPELRDDPPATERPVLPLSEAEAGLALTHSRNAPTSAWRWPPSVRPAGDALLVGEVYLPSARWQPYLEHLDAVFAFELLHSPAGTPSSCAGRSRRNLGRQGAEGHRRRLGAVEPRLRPAGDALRPRERARRGPAPAHAPGMAFLYQGDEIGLGEGPGAEPPYDRAGRDRYRHPMQWDGSPSGGFSDGEPWLAPVDPAERNVADQRGDPDSMLSYVRELIRARRELGPEFRLLDANDGVLAYRRGEHLIAVRVSSPG